MSKHLKIIGLLPKSLALTLPDLFSSLESQNYLLMTPMSTPVPALQTHPHLTLSLLLLLPLPPASSLTTHIVSRKPWTCIVHLRAQLCLILRPHGLARQTPLSLGFSRQGYFSGLPFPPPGNLLYWGIEPSSPALAGGFFATASFSARWFFIIPWTWHVVAAQYIIIE